MIISEKDEDIYAVGRVAQSQLGYLETIDYIRHPSYGRKTECVTGILSIQNGCKNNRKNLRLFLRTIPVTK